jgi:UDP-N-acetylglucosamine diphosphorylase/glucosamine-1-phosphate N-acetyltransferase
MTQIYLLEPAPSPEWFPFSHCRPVAELRAGAWLIRERWEAAFEGETAALFGDAPQLRSFVEEGVPPITARDVVSGPAVVGRSDFAPSGVKPALPSGPARLVNDGTTVGWWVPEGATWQGEHPDWSEVELDGVVLHGAFDVVTAQEHLLAPDTQDFTNESADPLPQGCVVIGDPGDVVILGAAVEPGTTFDVRQGVVVIEQHCHVKSGTRFEGPVYVGPGSEILGGSIHQCSIGPRCKIRGEVANTTFLGYANKAHDGFVGHSVVGRWVNLGAGTTTSNLKNTYGIIRLRVGEAEVDSGRQFLGTLFGDHCKTAIGTMLSTGAVIGCGANVLDYSSAPKYVPAFAWGAGGGVMQRDGFLKTAARVMPRRQIEFNDAIRNMLGTIYDIAVSG